MATAEPDSTVHATEEVPEVDLNAKIIKQVEFYFGDKNLPRDKFLLRILHEEGNEPGWVPLTTLLDFNRLMKLSTDTALIATALKQSTSGLIEVSEDNTKIRRITPMAEINDSLFFDPAKSVYAKGFPVDTTIDELESFFESFGKITLIQRRRQFQTKTFKGSVFVEFAEASFATEFVKNDAIKYKEIELIRLMKNDYGEKKALERQEGKKNARLLKAEQLREKAQIDNQFLKGALLKLEGLSNTTSREKVKELFPENTIKFVDMKIGDIECIVMFRSENGAVESMKEIQTEENTLKLGDSIVKYSILDGEEEQNEWVRISQFMNDSFNKNKDKKRGFKGGRGGGRKRDWGSKREFGNRGRGARKFQGSDEKVSLGKRRSSEKNTTTADSEQPQPKHTRIANSDED